MADMQIDKTISWGNIVSWVVVALGLTMGYGKVANATSQNSKDVAEIKYSNEARTVMVQDIRVEMAKLVTKGEMAERRFESMDKKIDDLLAEVRKQKQ